MRIVNIPAGFYRQFDADFLRDVPAEGYGGWERAVLPMDLDRTALALMHAWDFGTREQYPGWHRAVEYIPRAEEICRKVFPRLLGMIRASGMRIFHIACCGDYLNRYPGYLTTVKLTGQEPGRPETVISDPVLENLRQFKSDRAFPGAHNRDDIARGFAGLDFPSEAKPADDEPVAVTEEQLFALCKKYGVNHLVYAGFTINGCLLASPCGIVDMSRRGILCSAIRQAVTAIENKQTARTEAAKELGLWYVSIISGFVYDANDFINGISGRGETKKQ